MSRTCTYRALCALGALGLLLPALPALAAEETVMEEVVVTGSRIPRTDLVGYSPVTVINAADLASTGNNNVADVLKSLPAIIGNSLTTSTTNGGTGASNVALRGLPAGSTLILVNGRRQVPDGVQGETPDLYMIPMNAIERVEILKDGASAIYGSDAIAGVINFITKRDYQGLSVEGQYSQTSENDLKSKEASLTYGAASDRGHFVVGARYLKHDPIKSADRSVSSPTLTPSSAIPAGRATVSAAALTASGRPDLVDPMDPTAAQVVTVGNGFSGTSTPADYRLLDGTDSFDYSQFTDAIMRQERRNLFVSADYALTEDVTAFMESSYGYSNSSARAAPTPIFTLFETGNLMVDAANPFNPWGEDLSDVRKRLVELGPRGFSYESNTFRFVAGLEGNFTQKWSWDFAWDWAETDTTQNASGIVNKANLVLGIGDPAACTAVANLGCVPVNLLGGPGSVTQAQADWIGANVNIDGSTKVNGYAFNVVGDAYELPAGTLGIAAGIEYRKEDISFDPNSLTANFLTIGNTNFEPTSGDRDVTELYAEAAVPILSGVPLASSLEAELAVRWSDYSDFGNTTNPKFGLKWRPIDELLLRGTYSEGFRAPSLRELWQGGQEDFAFLIDPCQDATNVGVVAGCNVQSDPGVIQFLAIEGGNPDLKAEESTSYTFGAVWQPSMVDGLNFTVDYFNISVDNAVDNNPQFIIDQFRDSGNVTFANRVTLDGANNIRLIDSTNLNLAKREVQGVDISADYTSQPYDWGIMSLALATTNYFQYLDQADATAPKIDVVGDFVDDAAGGRGSIPKWKLRTDLRWTRGPWDVTYTFNYVSELKAKAANASPDTTNVMFGWKTHDIQVNYTFAEYVEGLRVTAGMKNIFDNDPPTSSESFNDNIDARTHNLLGRWWYFRLGYDLL